jgi:hypothetical protein
MMINNKTMLFEGMTPAERVDLLAWAKAGVLDGNLPQPQPQWVTDWMTVFGYNDTQQLLVISTALPQRVLLSLALE